MCKLWTWRLAGLFCFLKPLVNTHGTESEVKGQGIYWGV